jgi:DNA-binding NarL/FixJ family response regulator
MTETAERTSRPVTATAIPSEARRVSVYVIEELTAIRELVVGFVTQLDGFRVVGSSGNRAEAERDCARLTPDLALVDWLLLSDVSGVNLAEAIRRCSGTTRVLIFSAASDAHFVSDAIAAGVAGFVVKSASLDTLAKALRTVADGKQYFCSEMGGVLRELLRQSTLAGGRAALLTQREREVLREIAKGHFSKEIAATFNLSVFTIENIRRRIMKKTGLKSVAELTLHALRLRLIVPPVNGTSEAVPR